MKIALITVGALMIVATVLPLLRKDAWWIRVFDFPRIQITVITVIVALSYLYISGVEGVFAKVFTITLFACLIYQSYMMYQYMPFARKQVQKSRSQSEGASLRLLFANVLMSNRNADELRDIIRREDPDVILTVETNKWWQGELKEFEKTHPLTVHHPLDNTYGMLFYSRLELINPEVTFLVEDDIPSIHTKLRLPNGKVIELHCLHPRPPFPTEAEQSTERDAELLIVGRAIKKKDEPVIVMGDLNDVAWSRTNYLFQDISGLLDPRIGRGFFNTFHASYPFIRFPLDHFFHTNHFRLIELKRLENFGSDHFPVMIALSYEPDAEFEQEELQPDAAQVSEAEEKIEMAV